MFICSLDLLRVFHVLPASCEAAGAVLKIHHFWRKQNEKNKQKQQSQKTSLGTTETHRSIQLTLGKSIPAGHAG